MNTQYNASLVHIIEANLDRIERYKKAKELVNKTNFLTYLFDQCIKQSESYVDRLNNLLEIQGVESNIRKSLFGHLYRGWISACFYLSINKNKSVLLACINAEENLLFHYEKVLKDESIDFYFPLLRKILEAQRNRIALTLSKLNGYLGKEIKISINETKLVPLNEVG